MLGRNFTRRVYNFKAVNLFSQLTCHTYGGVPVISGRNDIVLCNTWPKKEHLLMRCFPGQGGAWNTCTGLAFIPVLSSVGHSRFIHGAGRWMRALSVCRVTDVRNRGRYVACLCSWYIIVLPASGGGPALPESISPPGWQACVSAPGGITYPANWTFPGHPCLSPSLIFWSYWSVKGCASNLKQKTKKFSEM